jgi:hypothetical protein
LQNGLHFKLKIQVKSADLEGNEVYNYKDVAVVELGHICKAYEETKKGLRYAQTLQQLGRWIYYGLEPYYLRLSHLRCIPKPCGINTFAGCDEVSILNPSVRLILTSEYCVIPEIEL